MSVPASGADAVGGETPRGGDFHGGENVLAVTLSASTRSSQGSQTSVFETTFHGACPRCHRWYHKVTLRLFKNPRKHKRFRCTNPRCRRLLFGLGGTSTQTTLVSQETTSHRGSWDSAVGGPAGFHGCTDIGNDGNLGTIAELTPSQRSAVSRQASQRSAAAQHAASTPVQAPDNSPFVHLSHARAEEGTLPAKAGEEHGTNKRTSAPADRGKLRKIAKKFLGRVHAIRVRVSRPFQTGHQQFRNEESSRSSSNGAIEDRGRELTTPSRQSVGIPVNSNQEHLRQASSVLKHVERANKVSQENKITAEEKCERIRRIRKEKTARERALHKPRCMCSEGCQCMKDAAHSRSSGEGQPRSVRTSEIEGHRFPTGVELPEETSSSSRTDSWRLSSNLSSDGRLQFPPQLELAGIGGRFAEERRRLSQETSSTRVGTRARPLSSFSQAPTVISNESSISLSGSIANLLRRPAGSRPPTPQVHVNPDPEREEDNDHRGPP